MITSYLTLHSLFISLNTELKLSLFYEVIKAIDTSQLHIPNQFMSRPDNYRHQNYLLNAHSSEPSAIMVFLKILPLFTYFTLIYYRKVTVDLLIIK